MSRHVIITGGSSGLGLALAGALLKRGDRVALMARNAAKLDDAAATLRREHPAGFVTTAAVDVTDQAALEAAVATVVEQLGGLDLLVNSAGVLKEGYFETLSDATHRELMEINYFGTLNAVRAALPFLKAARAGRVVNVSSVAGLTGVFGYSAYCASKHAVIGLSETLRFELTPQGVTVQVVCPGEFDSPMVDELDAGRTPENREHAHVIPKVSVDVVVRDTLRGLDGDAFMIVPGALAKLSVLGLRHLPRMSRVVGAQRIRAVYAGPRRR